MITLLLFLLLFFMIIEVAIVVYNRGTVINASREGARQGSLYWVDPSLFAPTTPELNQRLKRSMVDSVMSWAQTNLLIDPGNSGLSMTLQINFSDMLNPVEHISTNDTVTVAIDYPHRYIVLSGLSGTEAPLISASTTLGVE
jgi:hypothetical protein